MAPSEVQIPEIVPPKEMSVAEILAEAVNRNADSTIDIKALLANADVVEGRTLTEKGSLIGLPHIITSVSFREGTKDALGAQHDFVSCEYTTITDIPIEGVYNDGSTGIRRQVVAYLAHKGLIPEAYKETPDAPIWVATEDESKDPTFIVRFLAPRGLRVSDYKNEYTNEGRTFYLA
jgi:hypothetical protein